MSKPFFTTITNAVSTANTSKDNRGTLCSIHNTMTAEPDNPSCQQIMKICPMSTKVSRINTAPVTRSRSKSRSRSRNDSSRTTAGTSANWSTIINSTSAFSNSHSIGDHLKDPQLNYPVSITPSYENAGNCSTMCRCTSKVSTAPVTGKKCCKNSHSVLRTSDSLPVYSQPPQNFICADEIVTDLKDEMRKVKCQLEEINASRQDGSYDKGELSRIYQLKAENKQLKKNLELKKKLYITVVKELERARDILNDYEKKVSLLHQQAVKSSKVMKQSKEKFCQCLKEKEDAIKELKKTNQILTETIGFKDAQYSDLNQVFENLQNTIMENNEQCLSFKQNTQNFCECIKVLENQLQDALTQSGKYKSEVEELKQHMNDENCETCKKLESRLNKQRDKHARRTKEHEKTEELLKEEISNLSQKMHETESLKKTSEEECSELQTKLKEYEQYCYRCSYLEKECQRQCAQIEENEEKFGRERGQLRELVDELTTVVQRNKITLLELSNINREQESLLVSQSDILSKQEEQLKFAKREINTLKERDVKLDQEMVELRSSLSGPCPKDSCNSVLKQLDDIKNELNMEKDNQLVKQKIIEDQSQTIVSLQKQLQEKTDEANSAREERFLAEEEILKINDDLMRKHMELERELDEKGRLLQKLKNLECQRASLSKEMAELEKLVEQYSVSQKYEDRQHKAITEFKKQVVAQRREWEAQKFHLAEEKEKAIKAAKFATQKLVDTVADFQKQVSAQRQVQIMLTRMLHDKEEELQIVKDKITSINHIVSEDTLANPKLSLNDIYLRNKNFELTDQTTTNSLYSSCSSCSRNRSKSAPRPPKTELQEVFEAITRTEEEPIRDY